MHHIETINKFIKRDLLATETYQQTLGKFRVDSGLAGSKSLTSSYENYIDAVFSRALISRLEGNPSDESRAWGNWAKILQ